MSEAILKGGNKFRVRQYCCRDAKGKKIYCTDKTVVFESVKERKAFIREMETEHANHALNGTGPDRKRMTVNAFLTKWLAHKKVRLDLNTFADYEWNLDRYVRPAIGELLLSTIRLDHIEAIYDDMLERKLSARSVRNLHGVLSQALKKARATGLISNNPAELAKLPPTKKPKIRALEEDEAQRFLGQTMNDRLGPLFAFMLANGPRPEECYGLQWSEVDLEKGRVQIWRVLKWNRKGGGWRFRDYPKSEKGERTLELEPQVVAILKRWRKDQLVERLRSKRYEDHNLVFCTPTGEPLYPTNVHSRHFKPILTAAGLDRKTRLYDLRHTFATLSIASGVDPKTVSHDLGHENPTFTMSIYCHFVERMRRNATGKLVGILFPKTKAKHRAHS
jgi:integrase